ncbi:MAG: GNAT family N-acetyltransferase [Candidatus Hydrogenedentes bacterium]|nr:GNAT family N-acetyltransferase [Candidatus Hydrogenedentota bacterium]
MQLMGDGFVLRPWQTGDEAALVRHANNRKIWRNLMNRIPYPYTWADAEDWIHRGSKSQTKGDSLAIVIDGEAVGGIGSEALTDVHTGTRVAGYWLSELHWGRGIATAMLRLYLDYLFQDPDLHRVEAHVYAWNPASARVLEKNGFVLEGRKRQSVFKDSEYVDELIYGLLRQERG